MIVKMPLENFLIIDIETVSEQKNFESLQEDWQKLWEDKVHHSLPENITADEYYPQRAGVMAEFAKVICISMAYFKKEGKQYQLRVKSIADHDEKVLLGKFIQTILMN